MLCAGIFNRVGHALLVGALACFGTVHQHQKQHLLKRAITLEVVRLVLRRYYAHKCSSISQRSQVPWCGQHRILHPLAVRTTGAPLNRSFQCSATSFKADEDGRMGTLGGREIVSAAHIDPQEYYVKQIGKGASCALEVAHKRAVVQHGQAGALFGAT